MSRSSRVRWVLLAALVAVGGWQGSGRPAVSAVCDLVGNIIALDADGYRFDTGVPGPPPVGRDAGLYLNGVLQMPAGMSISIEPGQSPGQEIAVFSFADSLYIPLDRSLVADGARALRIEATAVIRIHGHIDVRCGGGGGGVGGTGGAGGAGGPGGTGGAGGVAGNTGQHGEGGLGGDAGQLIGFGAGGGAGGLAGTNAGQEGKGGAGGAILSPGHDGKESPHDATSGLDGANADSIFGLGESGYPGEDGTAGLPGTAGAAGAPGGAGGNGGFGHDGQFGQSGSFGFGNSPGGTGGIPGVGGVRGLGAAVGGAGGAGGAAGSGGGGFGTGGAGGVGYPVAAAGGLGTPYLPGVPIPPRKGGPGGPACEAGKKGQNGFDLIFLDSFLGNARFGKNGKPSGYFDDWGARGGHGIAGADGGHGESGASGSDGAVGANGGAGGAGVGGGHQSARTGVVLPPVGPTDLLLVGGGGGGGGGGSGGGGGGGGGSGGGGGGGGGGANGGGGGGGGGGGAAGNGGGGGGGGAGGGAGAGGGGGGGGDSLPGEDGSDGANGQAGGWGDDGTDGAPGARGPDGSDGFTRRIPAGGGTGLAGQTGQPGGGGFTGGAGAAGGGAIELRADAATGRICLDGASIDASGGDAVVPGGGGGGGGTIVLSASEVAIRRLNIPGPPPTARDPVLSANGGDGAAGGAAGKIVIDAAAHTIDGFAQLVAGSGSITLPGMVGGPGGLGGAGGGGGAVGIGGLSGGGLGGTNIDPQNPALLVGGRPGAAGIGGRPGKSGRGGLGGAGGAGRPCRTYLALHVPWDWLEQYAVRLAPVQFATDGSEFRRADRGGTERTITPGGPNPAQREIGRVSPSTNSGHVMSDEFDLSGCTTRLSTAAYWAPPVWKVTLRQYVAVPPACAADEIVNLAYDYRVFPPNLRVLRNGAFLYDGPLDGFVPGFFGLFEIGYREIVVDTLQDDCDNNGIPNGVEITLGAADCNANGIPDACELAWQTTADANGNLVPDECEGAACTTCHGDVNLDGVVNIHDQLRMVESLLDFNADGCADVNRDGHIDGRDIQAFVSLATSNGGLGVDCTGVFECPGFSPNDPRQAHPTPYAADALGCATVCAHDRYCGDTAWDHLCAVEYDRLVQPLGLTPDQAIPIGTGTFAGSTANRPPPPPPMAPFCGNAFFSPTRWYCFTPPCSGFATATTCGATVFDTVLAVYDGCANGAPQLACDDNMSGCPLGLGFESSVGWPVIGGQSYLIAVSGANGVSGTFALTTSVQCVGPANDSCANASPVFDGLTAWSNVGATTDGPDEACVGTGDFRNDVWYCYQAVCDGVATVSLCQPPPAVDTVVAVYGAGDGPGCGTLCPTGPNTAVACNDDGCGDPRGLSTVVFATEAGRHYLIRVGGWRGAQGSGMMSISCGPPCGMACSGVLESEPCVASTNGGCDDPAPLFMDIPIACGGAPTTVCGSVWTNAGIRDTDWYRVTIPAGPNRALSVSAHGQFGGTVEILSGACPTPAMIGSAAFDADCANVAAHAIVAPGDYLIRVAPRAASGLACQVPAREYQLDISCAPVCALSCSGGDEIETCGASTNAGCGDVPAAFSEVGVLPVGSPVTRCGRVFAQGGTRDLDWFRLEVPPGPARTLTVTLHCEFSGFVRILTDGCVAPETLGYGGTFNNCGVGASVLIPSAPPGSYVVLVGPAALHGLPCAYPQKDYRLTLRCD